MPQRSPVCATSSPGRQHSSSSWPLVSPCRVQTLVGLLSPLSVAVRSDRRHELTLRNAVKGSLLGRILDHPPPPPAVTLSGAAPADDAAQALAWLLTTSESLRVVDVRACGWPEMTCRTAAGGPGKNMADDRTLTLAPPARSRGNEHAYGGAAIVRLAKSERGERRDVLMLRIDALPPPASGPAAADPGIGLIGAGGTSGSLPPSSDDGPHGLLHPPPSSPGGGLGPGLGADVAGAAGMGASSLALAATW